jgi:ribosome-binding factor A
MEHSQERQAMKFNRSLKLATFSILFTMLGAIFFPGELRTGGVNPLTSVMAQSASKPQQSPATPPSPQPPDLVNFGEPDKNQAWTLRLRDNGNSLEVHVLGEISFTSDYRNIQSISRNGYFRLEEQRGSTSRSYDVRPDASGKLRTRYEVQGKERPLDAEAQSWFGVTLLDIVRQNALDVSARVRNLLSSGGVSAVRDEITKINNDYAKSRYFDELVRNGKLDSATLAQVERQLASEVKNDYYKARVFITVAGIYLNNDANLPAFFENVGTLGNDYYWATVLDAVLKEDKLSRAAITGTLKSATSISSDYEKARVMLKVAGNASLDKSLRASLLDAAKTINSEYERNRVLAAVASQANQD